MDDVIKSNWQTGHLPGVGGFNSALMTPLWGGGGAENGGFKKPSHSKWKSKIWESGQFDRPAFLNGPRDAEDINSMTACSVIVQFERTNERMNEWTNERMEGWMDRRTDGSMH